MNEVDKLKTLISNIKTLIAEYEASLTVVAEDLSTNIKKWFDDNTSVSKDKNIMTPYATPYNWPRNANCWAKNLDLSGYAACIVPLGGVGGGTLITRKHVLLANHVPYAAAPFHVFFVNNKNISLIYFVVRAKRIGNTDILIGELDREVDASLKIYNVLPANYLKYFNKNPSFPILHSDQERKALIANYGTIENIDNSSCVTIVPPTESTRTPFYEQVIGGDSGNPVFTVIDNEPVLIGGWYKQWYNGGGLATLLPNYITDINNTLASLSPGYKLNEANLTKFKVF